MGVSDATFDIVFDVQRLLPEMGWTLRARLKEQVHQGGIMRWRKLMERKSVTVKFDGDLEEVAVEDFVSVVLGYSHLLQESAREVSPDIRLDVKVSSTRPGCLEAVLSAIAKDGPGLLAAIAQTSDQLGNVIGTANSYLELRKFLGDKGAPKEVDKGDNGVRIVAGDGSTINVTNNVYNLSESQTASSAAARMFSIDEEDESIQKIVIASEDGKVFSANREEFPRIKTAPSCSIGSERHAVEERAYLSVTRPVLEKTGARKWEFYYKGFRFSAKVVDKDFFERFGRHEFVFGIGDALIADLDMRQTLNNAGVWENKEYRVLKVYEVVNQSSTDQLEI